MGLGYKWNVIPFLLLICFPCALGRVLSPPPPPHPLDPAIFDLHPRPIAGKMAEHAFEDIFIVTRLDPDGKKFDNGHLPPRETLTLATTASRPLPMSDSDASPPPPVAASAAACENSPSKARKEELLPVGEKISELNESQSELLGRLRGLKEDLQNWRNNLDTQVKKYKSELSDIKSTLNSEIELLRSDFQELRTTLKKQQEDVSISLKNLGLQDATESNGNNRSGEENTSEGASANLGNLKLADNPETHDESRGVKEKKNETAEDGTAGKDTKTESASDE